jgi:hypothetical protein
MTERTGFEPCQCGHAIEEHGHDPKYSGSTACHVEECDCIAYEADDRDESAEQYPWMRTQVARYDLMEPQTDERQRMGDPRVPVLEARIAELEACVLEYWHAKDWDAVGAADATAAKLMPADMQARAALASGNVDIEYAIKLQRLIENLNYDTETPYPELHHHKMIVAAKGRIRELEFQINEIQSVRNSEVKVSETRRLRICELEAALSDLYSLVRKQGMDEDFRQLIETALDRGAENE